VANEDSDNAQPVTKGRRFMKLAGMTASVAAGYAGSRVKGLFQSSAEAREARKDQYKQTGERIAKTLGELKGAAMKIGQMASIGSDILPKELSDALTKLQKDSPPMSFDVIAGQIERELGSHPSLLFAEFDEKPFASASIGQVHRAKTDDGRDVVVKVQYPGVDESVDSDLSHLKLALKASGLVNRVHKAALDDVFVEIKKRLHEELDYCNEADNVRTFRAHHAQHDFIVVPSVVGERSSQRVLTMSYEPGDSIADMDKLDYSQESRDLLGENLFRSMGSQLFELQAVQADPNPANFAFRKDGTVVLYDFGCVKYIDEDLITPYRALLNSALDADFETAEEYLFVLGVRVEGTEQPPPEFYRKWRDLFLVPLEFDGFYDYGGGSLHQEAMKMAPETIKWMSSFRPPDQLVFIDRTILGNYGNLRDIRARGQYLPALKYFLGRDDGDIDAQLRPGPESTAASTSAAATSAAPKATSAAPKSDAPKTEAPKTEAPKTEASKTEAPKTEAPKTEAPTDNDATSTDSEDAH
jgi:predicted unusual protein kinase regulating ubiquinone biosynthesis (AarF/ABC1/UbiB family)